MDLAAQLSHELIQLAGFASTTPKRIEMTDDDGIRLSIDFVGVDTMSCAFRELLVHIPKLVGKELGVLKRWADELSKRVTYLLESIGPIEVDKLGDQILIRSNPPDRTSNVTKFYEVLLSARANGTFSLKRFAFEPGQTSRTPVDIQLTHEVLHKLVRDLLESAPS